MTWGRGKWGAFRWGVAESPFASSKFTGYAAATHLLTSKFHAAAAITPTALSSMFVAYAAFDATPISSMFWGSALKAIISKFKGRASVEVILTSKFFGYAGDDRTGASKFAGLLGAETPISSKFAGALQADRSIGSKFFSYAGYLLSLTSKFAGDAGAYVVIESKFAGDAGTTIDLVMSKFYGQCGRIPLVYSRFHGVSFKLLYYSLGGIVITNNLLNLEWDGFETKVNSQEIPGSEDVELEEVGSDTGAAELELRFDSDADLQAFREVVNNLSTDLVFYPGRDDRYIVAKIASVKPVPSLYLRQRFKTNVTLMFKHKYLLGAVPNTYGGGLSYALPAKSPSYENIGSYKSQFTFSVQGVYSGGHSQSLIAKLYDGSTVERQIPFSDKLLSDQLAVLDEEGVITETYSDTFTTSAKYLLDTVASNVTWSSGKVRIAASGSLTYRLAGPLLLNKEIQLLADLTIVGGSPLIQISVDSGVTYATSIPAASLKNGSATYYLTGSAKYSNVYVRFSCPAGATLDINSLSFTTERDITQTAYYDQLPEIEPGDSRALEISGTGGSAAAKITINHRNRWRP